MFTRESILEAYRNTRVLVLGANGFIGRWVSRLLTSAGSELSLAVRDPELARQVFMTYQVDGAVYGLDAGDSTQVESLFSEVKPQITFNLAGYGVDPRERDERDAARINAELPSTCCQVLSRGRDRNWNGQAIVHVGTAAEYGRATGDLREETHPEPFTLYGLSKLEGTRRFTESCRNLSEPGLTARLITNYEQGEHPGRLLPSLLHAASSHDDLELTSGRQERDFTYVEDAAEGFLRLGLISSAPGNVINLATGRLYSVRHFVTEAARILSINIDRLHFGALPDRDDEMHHDPVNNRRLMTLTGWQPDTDIAGGISQTLQFLETTGSIK